MYYASLEETRSYLRLTGSETADDEQIKRLILKSVDAIDTYCRRRFDPYITTYKFDYPLRRPDRLGYYSVDQFVVAMNAVGDWLDQRLKLDQDLLALSTVTNGDGNEMDTDKLILEPSRLYPKQTILIEEGSSLRWQTGSSGQRKQVIEVEGIWGYHTRYGESQRAWLSSLDTVQNNPLTSSGTSLTVSDADGVNAGGFAPRFDVGQLIRIGTEFWSIVAINTTTNVLTIVRGYNGSTAASHVQNVVIDIWRPEGDVILATQRLVAWRYRQKDVDAFDKTTILGTGISIVPASMPEDVIMLLPHPKEPGRL